MTDDKKQLMPSGVADSLQKLAALVADSALPDAEYKAAVELLQSIHVDVARVVDGFKIALDTAISQRNALESELLLLETAIDDPYEGHHEAILELVEGVKKSIQEIEEGVYRERIIEVIQVWADGVSWLDAGNLADRLLSGDFDFNDDDMAVLRQVVNEFWEE